MSPPKELTLWETTQSTTLFGLENHDFLAQQSKVN
jgi:hypothetical protein